MAASRRWPRPWLPDRARDGRPAPPRCHHDQITDIAGLVKGAHEGKGLGSAFLSHIYAVDAIYHLVRAFKNDEIEHVEGEPAWSSPASPARAHACIHLLFRLRRPHP
jgi:hypothetical protein